MTQHIGENTEEVVNVEIARIMRRECPSWEFDAEIEDIFEGEPNLTPDIVAWVPHTQSGDDIPVVIEIKFNCNNHRKEVKEKAEDRLGKRIKNSGDVVEISLAILVPKRLKTVPQIELYREISEISNIEFKILQIDDDEDDEDNGWSNGKLVDILYEISDCVDSLT